MPTATNTACPETSSEDDFPETISVLLVNQNDLVRRELRRMLNADGGMQVVGEGRDLVGALAAVGNRPPRVLVSDVLPESGALRPPVATVLVARRIHPGSLRAGLAAGALGYVLEDAAETDLVPGVRAAARGRRRLSGAIERLLVQSCAQPPAVGTADAALAALTDREREILRLVADGRRSHEIARALRIASATVASHRRSLMAKLGVHNLAQVVRFAVRVGMVS